jgi:NAD(P)-dependent dehydrogenase (short-subunit alcohol dehydrogenase family)
LELKDKIAIITGGGRGIGRAIALALAREGADVVVVARTESELRQVASDIESNGRRSLVVVADISVPEQIEVMVDTAIGEFGRIDVLINNSGIQGPIVTVSDMDLEGWTQTLAVNLTGAMLCAKYVLKKSMIPRRSGVIVNISSASGRRGPANRSPYSSSKFGMVGLTQSLATEVGRQGIRVNCIAPGLVETDLTVRMLREASEQLNRPYERLVASINARTALDRMVTPEEVAALAVFLASEKSSGITGQTVNCDVGLEMD